ncbi:MAG TPA: hypothetical protein VF458_04390 [Ktedonobacteraceae bacterium]
MTTPQGITFDSAPAIATAPAAPIVVSPASAIGVGASAPALMMSAMGGGGNDSGGSSGESSGGNSSKESETPPPEQNYTPNPNIRPHGEQPSPRPSGTQSHHPEQQTALGRSIANYNPDEDPSLLMSTTQHRATFAAQAAQRAGGAAFEAELGSPAALEEAATIMTQAGVAPETAGQVALEHSGYLFSITPADEVLMCLP